ncbi:hypothetical protein VTN00DRAFT_3473 [Thermoascus crustaceus]|uniref:uncharacterized protein n=1 Tax=Thermoascus crustaceus TaxID=5088 RepID=UPI0037431220
MTDLLTSSTAGAIFGTALASSGVYLPSVTTSQMKLQDFHMLKVFLTASSASALIIALYEHLTTRTLPRRTPASLGFPHPLRRKPPPRRPGRRGMALAGACPGTVLVQVGTGVPSGQYAMLGGVLGGVLYSYYARRPCSNSSSSKSTLLPGMLGVAPSTALILFEAMCVAAIVAAWTLAPAGDERLPDAVVGGLLIGAAQLGSFVITKALVGVSTFYEDLGKWVMRRTAVPRTKAVVFACGILASSYVLATTVLEMIGRGRAGHLAAEGCGGRVGDGVWGAAGKGVYQWAWHQWHEHVGSE